MDAAKKRAAAGRAARHEPRDSQPRAVTHPPSGGRSLLGDAFEESDDVYDKPANELRVALHRARFPFGIICGKPNYILKLNQHKFF